MDFAEVAAAVLERVEPYAEERAALADVVETVLDRTRAAIADLDVAAEPIHVGSTARDTWIAEERDVDVFVRFPTDLPREELERLGLEVGHAVLPTGREEYADHPYVTGAVAGFDVDVVPCYAVDSAAEIRSPVDRTPFHSDYVAARLTEELAAEIRVFRQLLRGVGVYGSDHRTRGFSGYLAELLVLAFGGAHETVEAIADWRPPVRLDPAGHGSSSFEDPLVVVDPTDPDRNVAAVLSGESLARLQHHARDVLAEPRLGPFFPDEMQPLDAETVREHVRRRGTTPLAVAFDAPDLVDDDLYPQLRRSLAGLGDELSRRGFDRIRQAAFATAPAEEGGRRALLLFELAVAELPAIERHEGPPLGAREHAEAFYATYAEDPAVYGPYIEGERYVVERERTFDSARALLESDAIFEVRLGAAIESALAEGYEVYAGESIAALAEAFGRELAGYFDPSP